MTSAIYYTATDGYLFQTLASATQARAHSSHPVLIFHYGAQDSTEVEAFAAACESYQISFRSLPFEALEGLHPYYSRFMVDAHLPLGIETALYLDGDTQVLGSLDDLLVQDCPYDILAARDPMVLVRTTDPRLRSRIDRWWERAGIPKESRSEYVNSGVMRMRVAAMRQIREEVLSIGRTRSDLPFPDQDAVNLACRGRLGIVSYAWNFPGFMLGTQVARDTDVRIIHFMSKPRPWNAPMRPWGRKHFQVYADIVGKNPQLRAYWDLFSTRKRLRYELQYMYKWVTERRAYSKPEFIEAYRTLERE